MVKIEGLRTILTPFLEETSLYHRGFDLHPFKFEDNKNINI